MIKSIEHDGLLEGIGKPVISPVLNNILLLSDLLYVIFRHAPIGFGACRKIL